MRACPRFVPLPTLALALGALAACERAPDVGREVSADSTAAPVAGDSAVAPRVGIGWIPDAGPVLLIATSPSLAAIVSPAQTDSSLAAGEHVSPRNLVGKAAVRVFGPGAHSWRATLASAPASIVADSAAEECVSWPLVRVVRDAPADDPPWTVGLIGSDVKPIALDSLRGGPGADSARVAAVVARLASQLPQDTAQGFSGLPFSVHRVQRFVAMPGVEAMVAEVIRRINQEANPREEHILFVAERQSDGGEWNVGYSERSSGPEEAIVVSDVLAAFTLGASQRPILVVARDHGDGVTYSLLARDDARSWRVIWNSAYAGC